MKIRSVTLCLAMLVLVLASLSASAESWRELDLGYYNLDNYQELTGETIFAFGESPILAQRVTTGELPPVEQRLPDNPLVQIPWMEMGLYGGELRWSSPNPNVDWMLRHLNIASMLTPPPHEDFNWPRHTGAHAGPMDPGVIESWELSGDGLLVTATLRKGLKWSDGVPVTTADVEYRIKDELMNQEIYPVVPEWLRWGGPSDQYSTELEIIDEYTFRITFAEPFGAFISEGFNRGFLRGSWDNFVRPKHFLQQFHRDYGEPDAVRAEMAEFGFDDMEDWGRFYSERVGSPPTGEGIIGLGEYAVDYPTLAPYVAVEARLDGTWIFERNPYFFMVDPAGNQLPYIDNLRRQHVADTEVLTLDIISGNTDVQAYALALDDYPLFAQNQERGNYVLSPRPVTQNHFLIYALNMAPEDESWAEVFGDIRFRKALSLALDREQIVESALLGFGRPAAYYPPPGSPYYEEGLDQLYAEYDPDQAKALLDDMGLVDSTGNGWRDLPNGDAFALPLEYFVVSPATLSGAELAVRYWEAVGVRVDAKLVEGGYWWTLRGGNEHAATIWWGHGANPLDDAWLGGNISTPTWRMWHLSEGSQGKEPPEWAKQILQAQDEFRRTPRADVETWTELGKRIWRLAAENVAVLGTAEGPRTPFVYSRDLGNIAMVEDNEFTYPTILDASTQWFFENPERR